MKVAILQSNYIPWKGYFDQIAAVDSFVLYDEVQYTKNDWRNRNKIKTPNGTQWLTIPVVQRSLDQRIDQTLIANKKWHKKHWNTIQTNYAKAPHFKDFAPRIRTIYEACAQEELLSKINFKFISEICSILEIDTKIIWSTDLELKGDKNEKLIQAVKKCDGNHYLSGPSAQSYLDLEAFQKEGISVNWMDYDGYPEYQQLFPPFDHGVSILDLIFNCGASARKYLKYT